MIEELNEKMAKEKLENQKKIEQIRKSVENFKQGRVELINELRAIAKIADKQHKNCQGVKAGGTSLSMVGGALSIVGFAVSGPIAPVAFGIGLGAGITSGFLNVGA